MRKFIELLQIWNFDYYVESHFCLMTLPSAPLMRMSEIHQGECHKSVMILEFIAPYI